ALARSLGKLSRSASVSTGLAEMKIENPGKGLAIAFATSPGEVAYDGEGEHSPFTSALLNHIGTANTDITEVMSKVTGEVYRKTDQAQRPWLNTSLTGSVVLNAVAKSPATTDPVAEAETSAPKTPSTKGDTLEVEKVVFQMARDSDRIEDYEAYLESYPNGVFEKFATRSIERLKRETTVDTGVAQQNAAAPTVGEQAAQLPTFSFNTAAAAPQTRTLGTDGTAGSFQLTPEQRAMPSNAATEQVLNMDWAKRREVQARLNLAGHNVGTPDGAIGPKTRAGLQGWQVKNGFLPTGYLNQPQYLFLVSATQQMYTVWVANNPAPVRRARTSTTRRSSQSRQNNGISPGVGAFLGGVATGLIIGKR
ncbi:MAG: caspase family protein, partial [Pseudomonadota bacterium]